MLFTTTYALVEATMSTIRAFTIPIPTPPLKLLVPVYAQMVAMAFATTAYDRPGVFVTRRFDLQPSPMYSIPSKKLNLFGTALL